MGTEPLVHLVQDDEVKGEVKALFDMMKEKSGAVPKWMRVMANNEDVLLGFWQNFTALMDDEPTDKKLKWKLAFKVSELNKCEFCVSVSKMQLKALGFGEEEIESVANIEKALTKEEEAAFAYAEAATTAAYNVDPKVFKALKEHFNDAQIVEITGVVGLFNYINRFNDALGVLPD